MPITKKKKIIKQIKSATLQLQDILNKIKSHDEEFKFIDNYSLVVEATDLMISEASLLDADFEIEKLEKSLLALLRQSNDLRILYEELFEIKKGKK